jgi:hypothetical protein
LLNNGSNGTANRARDHVTCGLWAARANAIRI